ncbi:mCG145107, partial [Mus musculus]
SKEAPAQHGTGPTPDGLPSTESQRHRADPREPQSPTTENTSQSLEPPGSDFNVYFVGSVQLHHACTCMTGFCPWTIPLLLK